MGNYEKLNFTSGQVLKAEHLNHMEEGIANAGGNEVFIAEYGVTTYKEVDDAYKAGKKLCMKRITDSGDQILDLVMCRTNGPRNVYYFALSQGMTSIGYTYSSGGGASFQTITLESKENKISTITDDNKNSTNEYPSMKALTSYAVPIPSSISVGQTVKVSAVDENGVPTAWETVDIPTVPTNVSAFANDAGYTTEERVSELIAASIASITNAEEVSY